uniref:Uncharacterized protein n=1 Tax=Rhizophora mucronata TaxID=61149 RepID=A0A2P2QE28_RHIMU
MLEHIMFRIIFSVWQVHGADNPPIFSKHFHRKAISLP